LGKKETRDHEKQAIYDGREDSRSRRGQSRRGQFGVGATPVLTIDTFIGLGGWRGVSDKPSTVRSK